MPFAKTVNFNPSSNVFSDIKSQTIVGTIIIATRPNATTPAFILLVTDAGELIVFDKTGTLVYYNNTGITGIVEASINQSGQVLIRVGNTITFFSATGVQVWQQTITSSVLNGSINTIGNAKVGTSFVVVAMVPNAAGVIAAIQFRSLTDGTLVVEYGTTHAISPNPPFNLFSLAVSADGATAYFCYSAAGGIRSHKFTRTGGIVNTGQGTVNVSGTTFASYTAFTNQDASINGYVCIGNAAAEMGVLDGSLAYLGTNTAFTLSVAHAALINPNGTRIVAFRLGGTGANALKFVTSSLFAVSDVVPAYTIPSNATAADVDEENRFFVGDSTNQQVHEYSDSTVQSGVSSTLGIANIKVAVVRNA